MIEKIPIFFAMNTPTYRIHAYFAISSQSRELLRSIAEQIEQSLIWQNYKSKTDFHATILYQGGRSLSESNTLIYNTGKKRERLTWDEWESNFIHPENEYDESFHKSHVFQSYVNGRTYLALIPHNLDSIFGQLQHGAIMPHISLGYLEWSQSSNQYYKDIIRQAVDNLLKQWWFIALDWSEFHISQKQET